MTRLGERPEHRVDEERHVVVGDLDDGDVGQSLGIGDADLRSPRFPELEKIEAAGGERRKPGRVVAGEVVFDRTLEQELAENRQGAALRFSSRLDDIGDERRDRILTSHHEASRTWLTRPQGVSRICCLPAEGLTND